MKDNTTNDIPTETTDTPVADETPVTTEAPKSKVQTVQVTVPTGLNEDGTIAYETKEVPIAVANGDGLRAVVNLSVYLPDNEGKGGGNGSLQVSREIIDDTVKRGRSFRTLRSEGDEQSRTQPRVRVFDPTNDQWSDPEWGRGAIEQLAILKSVTNENEETEIFKHPHKGEIVLSADITKEVMIHMLTAYNEVQTDPLNRVPLDANRMRAFLGIDTE